MYFLVKIKYYYNGIFCMFSLKAEALTLATLPKKHHKNIWKEDSSIRSFFFDNWQDFGFFWPPTPLHFLYGMKVDKSGHFWTTYLNCIDLLFKASIHQTTNLFFPIFFHQFFWVLAVEKDNKLFIGPKQIFSQFWTNEKFVLIFNCSTEKFS